MIFPKMQEVSFHRVSKHYPSTYKESISSSSYHHQSLTSLIQNRYRGQPPNTVFTTPPSSLIYLGKELQKCTVTFRKILQRSESWCRNPRDILLAAIIWNFSFLSKQQRTTAPTLGRIPFEPFWYQFLVYSILENGVSYLNPR